MLYELYRPLGQISKRAKLQWQDNEPCFSLDDLWISKRDQFIEAGSEGSSFPVRLARKIEHLTRGYKAEYKSPMLYVASQPGWLDPNFRRALEIPGWYLGCDGVVFNLYRRPTSVLAPKRQVLFTYITRTVANDLRAYYRGLATPEITLLDQKIQLCRLVRLAVEMVSSDTSLAFSVETWELNDVFRDFLPLTGAIDERWARVRNNHPMSSFYQAGEILDDIV